MLGNVTKNNKAVKFTNDMKYPSKEELAAAIQKLGLNAPKQTNISSVKKEMKAKKAPKL